MYMRARRMSVGFFLLAIPFGLILWAWLKHPSFMAPWIEQVLAHLQGNSP
jgi:hypothetical protein